MTIHNDNSYHDDGSHDEMTASMVLPAAGCCFHCGERLPKVPFSAKVLGKERLMCCLGCQLAATSIVEAGLSQYYLDRREISPTASLPDAMDFNVYNHHEIKSQFTYQEDALDVAELSVANLRCTACTWLIERRLHQMDGVGFCQVNLTQQRMRVGWNDDKVSIGEILSAINQIGYEARPYRQDTHAAMMQKENKKMLIRLVVAGFGAMQAMMFSVGLYFGYYTGIAPEHRDFLRWVSMVVSLPVIGYAGLPFFRSAFSALKVRQINMDIPISLALIITFLASSYATLTHTGETYFDSVAMFVFFLLAGRYVEQTARLKASNMAADLVVVEPKLVKKIGTDEALLKAYELKADEQNHDDFQSFVKDYAINKQQKPTVHGEVAWLSDGYFTLNHPEYSYKHELVHSVKAGDVVQVDAGGEIVGDGVLLSDFANVSQSLLTGESNLIAKQKGDSLLGGSQNDAAPLIMLVTKSSQESQIALIDRLINRAMSEKPKIAKDADRMARWFVARVLILAVVVGAVWCFINPSQAIWATVAVLVATCPCALGLATPIALTVATNRLAQLGFLATRGHTIETLSEIGAVAFDKTGTLTTGKAEMVAIEVFDEGNRHAIMLGVDSQKVVESHAKIFALAAALEMGSRHPIATSILNIAKNLHPLTMTDTSHHVGGGVAGVHDGMLYRIGSPKFALDGAELPIALEKFDANMAVVLSFAYDNTHNDLQPLAVFYFNDKLRSNTQSVIKALKKSAITPIMLTGDPSDGVVQLAKVLDIDYQQGLLPEDKVNIIKDLQANGKKVLMVGDGINDAPVLAAADVSVAMANASELAQVSADSVLLAHELTPIITAIDIAKKTKAVIRQNLRWAVVYNTAVIVPAAMGYVPPWLAAIGMSLSSLGVVLNAVRIKK